MEVASAILQVIGNTTPHHRVSPFAAVVGNVAAVIRLLPLGQSHRQAVATKLVGFRLLKDSSFAHPSIAFLLSIWQKKSKKGNDF